MEENASLIKSSDDRIHHWESNGYKVTKEIIELGDRTISVPRLGATGRLFIDLLPFESTRTTLTIFLLGFSRYVSEFSHEVDFCVGNSDNVIDRIIDNIVKCMFVGEISLVKFSFLDFDTTRNGGCLEQASCNSHFELKICLKTLENACPIYSWSFLDKIKRSKDWNMSAAKLFKEGRLVDSFYLFRRSLFCLTFATIHEKEPSACDNVSEARKLLRICMNNLAACHHKWKNYSKVVEIAKVISNIDDDVKMLFRVGTAQLYMNNFDEAEKILRKALALENTKLLNKTLLQLHARKRSFESIQAQRLKRMFQ